MIKIFFLFTIITTFLLSCKDINRNEVQDTFFDTKFGSSKSDLIYNFVCNGLSIETNNTVDYQDRISFEDEDEDTFSFGGFDWNYVVATCLRRQFCYIQFIAICEDLQSCKDFYYQLNLSLLTKYKLEEAPVDKVYLIDAFAAVKCKGKKSFLTVCAGSYEDEEEGEIIYIVSLEYGDEKLYKQLLRDAFVNDDI